MTVASQVYGGKSKEQATSTAAVNETAGVYATYQNEPIAAYFHSSSGGNTENSENVWGGAVPYIRSVSDPYDRHASNPHYGWNGKVATTVVSSKFKLTNEQVVSLRVTQKQVQEAYNKWKRLCTILPQGKTDLASATFVCIIT